MSGEEGWKDSGALYSSVVGAALEWDADVPAGGEPGFPRLSEDLRLSPVQSAKSRVSTRGSSRLCM